MCQKEPGAEDDPSGAKRGVVVIRRITWKEGAALCEEIRRSPPGIWTHDLNTIRSGPARFVTRVMAQDGLEIVYFRHSGGAGAWQYEFRGNGGDAWEQAPNYVQLKDLELGQMELF
ncbi:hypothetical protein MKY82_22165 [Paenibacillus sp. FSL W7-1279]|uniref:hypothetical protein n=1 Tax=Paenibacillus sp. FSL W7-1279 TaxID=2921697 RepID=UPI0030DBBB9F